MPKKCCCIVSCRSGYKRKKDENDNSSSSNPIYKTVFSFPENTDLRSRWIKFVNREGWNPVGNSVICIDHFEEEFLKRGKRVT